MATRQLELLVRDRLNSGAISTEEALLLFNRLLVAQNPVPSIHPFNQLLTALLRSNTSANPQATVFFLFNRLTRTGGIYPNHCTYGILINCCVQTNHICLAFGVLGRLLK